MEQKILFDISLNCMHYGWLDLRFRSKDQDISLDFDECLSDPLPGLVKTLKHLDTPDTYQWSSREHFAFTFTKKPVSDNYVNIVIDIAFLTPDDNHRIDVIISKDHYRIVIDNLCSSITASPDYPYHYPIYDSFFRYNEAVLDIANDIFDSLPEHITNSDEDNSIESRILSVCAKHIGKFTPDLEDELKTFNHVFHNKIVPTEWHPKG